MVFPELRRERMSVRKAVETDVSQMVELSEKKRAEYEKAQPLFWKKARDSREKQTLFFQSQIKRENVIALVEEKNGTLEGFLIAALVPAPPVYDPGGLTCLIDDFVVSAGKDWAETGKRLLEEAQRQARARGAVQSALFCGHLDQPKGKMLSKLGFSIATETYVKTLKD